MISPDDIPTRAENEGIVGEGVTLTLEEIGKRRLREVEFYVAGHALRSRFRDDEGNLKPYLFPQLLRITREWLGGGYLVCKGDTRPQYLLWRHFADHAVDANLPRRDAAASKARSDCARSSTATIPGGRAGTSTSRPRRARSGPRAPTGARSTTSSTTATGRRTSASRSSACPRSRRT